jgi:hypothetical protein
MKMWKMMPNSRYRIISTTNCSSHSPIHYLKFLVTVIDYSGAAFALAPVSSRNTVASRGTQPNSLPQVRRIAFAILLHVFVAYWTCQLSPGSAVGTFSNICYSAQVTRRFPMNRCPSPRVFSGWSHHILCAELKNLKNLQRCLWLFSVHA